MIGEAVRQRAQLTFVGIRGREHDSIARSVWSL